MNPLHQRFLKHRRYSGHHARDARASAPPQVTLCVATLRPKGAALVVDGPTEGQGLADGDPLGILRLFRWPDPADVVVGHHACLS